MKITELLEKMNLPIAYRAIKSDTLPEDVCVLMGRDTEYSGPGIWVLPADELKERVEKGLGREQLLLCAGIPRPLPDLPENISYVCLDAKPGAISAAAQSGLYQLRRRADALRGRENLLDRLLEGTLSGSENSAEQLQALGLNPGRRFCLVLVSFFGRMDEIHWESTARKLSAALRDCPVSEYRGDLVALCSMDGDEIRFPYPTGELEALLQRQGAYGVITNSAIRPAAIRVLYQQARAAMRFGLTLSKDAPSRIFHYEQYASYYLVELCANAFRSDSRVQNLVYLCHPALGSILRYDRKHGTNYTQILRKYLENNCNMSQTARQMFMHRNTMLNKLDTLRELLSVSLEDPAVREQLQFSFRVVDYAENILQGRTF